MSTREDWTRAFCGRARASRRPPTPASAGERGRRDLYADALRRLRKDRALLDRIAEALLEHETRDGGDVGLRMAG